MSEFRQAIDFIAEGYDFVEARKLDFHEPFNEDEEQAVRNLKKPIFLSLIFPVIIVTAFLIIVIYTMMTVEYEQIAVLFLIAFFGLFYLALFMEAICVLFCKKKIYSGTLASKYIKRTSTSKSVKTRYYGIVTINPPSLTAVPKVPMEYSTFKKVYEGDPFFIVKYGPFIKGVNVD